MKKLCCLALALLAACLPLVATAANPDAIGAIEAFVSKQEAIHPLDGGGYATRAGFGEGKMILAGQEVSFCWFASTNSDGNLEFTFDLPPAQLQRDMGVFARNTDKIDRVWEAWVENDAVVVGTGNCWLWPDCRYKEGTKATPLYKALEATVGQFKKLPMVKEMKILHYYR